MNLIRKTTFVVIICSWVVLLPTTMSSCNNKAKHKSSVDKRIKKLDKKKKKRPTDCPKLDC